MVNCIDVELDLDQMIQMIQMTKIIDIKLRHDTTRTIRYFIKIMSFVLIY